MNEKDIVRAAMKSRSFTQTMLAEAVGFSGQSAVSERLRGQSMRVDTFVKFLNSMGYEVVVRDKNRANKENTWTINE